jgi:hypothetical protein
VCAAGAARCASFVDLELQLSSKMVPARIRNAYKYPNVTRRHGYRCRCDAVTLASRQAYTFCQCEELQGQSLVPKGNTPVGSPRYLPNTNGLTPTLVFEGFKSRARAFGEIGGLEMTLSNTIWTGNMVGEQRQIMFADHQVAGRRPQHVTVTSARKHRTCMAMLCVVPSQHPLSVCGVRNVGIPPGRSRQRWITA